MAEAPLGVAVVGLGVGEQHARAYQASDSCELRWLYDLNPERSHALVDALGVGAVASSYEEIIRDPAVQLVSIASKDQDHCAQTLEALRAGKHVFVEKPLSRDGEELAAIKEEWAGHGGRLKLSSNLVLRAAPLYQWLKLQIDDGELGTPYSFDGDYLYGRLHKITEGWRKDVDDYSVMVGGGVHLIDLMVWLTGERPTSVYSVGNRICTEGTDFAYDDHVATTFRCPSGMIGRITANFGCVHAHQHVVRVFGTRATFLYDDAGPRLHVSRDPSAGSSPVDLSALPPGKGALIEPFVASILENENLDEHTQEIFDVMSISIASDEALRSDTPIDVRYV